jgi:beta-N-acetylhexosaminidase
MLGCVLMLGGVPAMAKQEDGKAKHAPSGAGVGSLSSKQLVGQRVIVSYKGLEPPDELFRLIHQGRVAGVIFFGGNISSKSQIEGVIAQLQRANKSSNLPAGLRRPLLMMTDQEGGLIRRLPGAPELSEQEIGESHHPVRAAREAGRGAGNNLKGAGMNVNLAPVLDVSRNNGGFLDKYQRTYSSNQFKVARLGSAFITAQQRTGVAATSKHFPGLGAAITDTDSAPVTLDLSKHTLRTVDEVPYHSAIAAGTEMVMLSNATYPALDPNRPAGLSRVVIQKELRGHLGFRGVTITDALEAGGLEDFGSVPRRGVLAADAGADLLLFAAQDISSGVEGSRGLNEALRDGRLDRSEYETSAKRVLALRGRLATGNIGR